MSEAQWQIVFFCIVYLCVDKFMDRVFGRNYGA